MGVDLGGGQAGVTEHLLDRPKICTTLEHVSGRAVPEPVRPHVRCAWHVLQQLVDRELVSDQFGGDTSVVRTSAKTGAGLDDLLETVLITSDAYVDPKADPKAAAVGTVIDSHLDRQRGPIATVLVQNGTLRVGDNVVAGSVNGKVRALLDASGRRVKEAGPSMPVRGQRAERRRHRRRDPAGG